MNKIKGSDKMAIGENASIFTIAQYGDYETFVKKFSAEEITKKK